MKRFIRAHYHWVIAAVALLQYTISGGVGNNASSLFVLEVTRDLGISRSAFFMAFSLKSMGSFCVSLMFGVIYRRFGYRVLAPVGLAVIGLGYLAMGFMGGIGIMCLLCIGMGLVSPFSDTAGVTQLVGNWFHRYKGTVLGLITSATGLGGALFSIILSAVLRSAGWRTAYRLCGVLQIIMAVIVVLVVRTRPEDMGLKPLGSYEEGRSYRHKRAKRHMGSWNGMPMRVLRHRPAFYLAMAATLLSCVCVYSCSSSVVPHLQDCGMSPAEAASMQSVMFLVMALMKILYGMFSDRFGPKKVVIFALCCGVAAAWLLSVVENTAGALAAVLVLSLALPLVSVMVPLLTTELFGSIASDVSVGLMLAMVVLSGVTASPMMNLAHGAVHSYRLPLKIVSAAMAGIIVLYAAVYLLASRDRKLWETDREKLMK